MYLSVWLSCLVVEWHQHTTSWRSHGWISCLLVCYWLELCCYFAYSFNSGCFDSKAGICHPSVLSKPVEVFFSSLCANSSVLISKRAFWAISEFRRLREISNRVIIYSITSKAKKWALQDVYVRFLCDSIRAGKLEPNIWIPLFEQLLGVHVFCCVQTWNLEKCWSLFLEYFQAQRCIASAPVACPLHCF